MNLLREKLRAQGHHVARIIENDAPDTSGINRAAEDSARIGREAQEWYMREYERQRPMRDRAADRADEVSLAQMDAMRRQTALGEEYAQYNRETFRPLEQSLVDEAMNYDTEAKREELAGKARGDTAQAFAGARGQMRRDLGRYGVNPADGGFTAATKQMATDEALADSFSRNKARSDATTLGRAMKMDAASLGRGLASNQATAAGLAINAGNSAAANGQIPVSLAQQGASMMGQGYSYGMQGAGQAGNLYAQQSNIQQRAGDNSGLWGALGNVAGAYLGRPGSDKNEKTGRKANDGEISLAAVRKTPVERWIYKPGGKYDDGGKQHVGPMAQEVQANMGDKAAPGGKVIDLVSMNGHTLAAVQQLDKNQRRLEKKVMRLADAKAKPGKRKVS